MDSDPSMQWQQADDQTNSFILNIFPVISFKLMVLTEKYPRKLLKNMVCPGWGYLTTTLTPFAPKAPIR